MNLGNGVPPFVPEYPPPVVRVAAEREWRMTGEIRFARERMGCWSHESVSVLHVMFLRSHSMHLTGVFQGQKETPDLLTKIPKVDLHPHTTQAGPSGGR